LASLLANITDNKEEQHIIHQDFEEFHHSDYHPKKRKTICDKATTIYDSSINGKRNCLKRTFFTLQKFTFALNERRKLLLKRYSNLFWPDLSECNFQLFPEIFFPLQFLVHSTFLYFIPALPNNNFWNNSRWKQCAHTVCPYPYPYPYPRYKPWYRF